jgi:hypothetical protein
MSDEPQRANGTAARIEALRDDVRDNTAALVRLAERMERYIERHAELHQAAASAHEDRHRALADGSADVREKMWTKLTELEGRQKWLGAGGGAGVLGLLVAAFEWFGKGGKPPAP